MAEKTAVLLIHGLWGETRDYKAVEKFLKVKGHDVEFFQFLYKRKFGDVSLDEIAEDLKAYIQTSLSGRKFFVIAFSQGGIIFRRLVLKHPNLQEQIKAAVTVCTPHHGSWLAFLWFGAGIAELRPKSKTLRELTGLDEKIPYYAVYNPLDSMVVPGTNARFEKARENKRVIAISHYQTFRHPETLRFIEKVIFP